MADFEAIDLVTGRYYGPFPTCGEARAFIIKEGFRIFAIRAPNAAEHYGCAQGTSVRDFAQAVSRKRLVMRPIPMRGIVDADAVVS